MPCMAKKPTSGSIWRPKYRRPDGEKVQSKTYWLTWYVNGHRHRESSETESWDEANRLLKRKQAEAVVGRATGPENIKLGVLLDRLLDDYRTNGKKSLYETRGRLEAHVRPALGHVRAAALTSDTLSRYVAMRQKEEAAPATINRELSIVRTALAIGAHDDPPVVLRVPYIRKLAEHNTREGFLRPAEYEVLRNELPEYLRPLFVVAYHTGARLGELLALKWPQVDFEAAQINVSARTTKNREAHTLPIYGEMRTWLDIAAAEREWYPKLQWVFSDHGVQILSFRKAWASACKRAGKPGLLFHDLRRSAARNMDMAGVPRKVIMAITGHKTESMFLRYRIVAAEDIKNAGAKMEAFMRTPEKQERKGAVQ
jgi:integrase